MTSGSNGRPVKNVFISYSHRDRSVIAPYLREMERHSIPYWYDKGLHAGDNFNNEIARNIKACDGFLLFLSNHSANSWYVFDELTYARNKRKQIIVVHLENNIAMPDGMEMMLGNLHQLVSGGSVRDCIQSVLAALCSGRTIQAGPITTGILNHSSDLLIRCRREFAHISSQMGVHNVEESIDPDLFCPIQTERRDGKPQIAELYNEICRDNDTNILLQAEGGLGKTYTFLHTMNRLLECDRPCAYIPCYLFTKENDQQEGPGLILKALSVMYLPEEYSEHALKEYFHSQTDKPFILFLDGYNEAVAKTRLSKEIMHISSTFREIKIVVSSRYADPVFSNYAQYTMRGLDRNHVAEILGAQGLDYSQLNYSLKKILLTPMFLRLYLRNEQLDKEIDTAAELMDQERKRILEIIRRSGSAIPMDQVEACFNRVFPDFVRNNYFSSSSAQMAGSVRDKQLGMSFSGKRLEDCLSEYHETSAVSKPLFRLLREYSVILRVGDRENNYAYQHEHYRDYWIAYSVYQELLRDMEECGGGERVERIVATLGGGFSQIVLRYIGELAQAAVKGSRLETALDCLRRDSIGDDSLWLDVKVADVTARIVDIYKLTLEDDIVGIDLSGLNLSKTNLNQAQTCTRNKKAVFSKAYITEPTFFKSKHISAPRRIEPWKTQDAEFLITVSDQDILISKLPDLDPVWQYPHVDADGKTVSTSTLCSSMMLGSCLLAADARGNVWEWDFYLKNGVPFVSETQKYTEAAPALKVFPWSIDHDPVIALQKKDGSILLFDKAPDPETGMEALGILDEEYQYSVPELKDADTRKTITSSPAHTVFYWAVKRQDGIHVMQYNALEMSASELCRIPDPGYMPEYMLCVGSEQASRNSRHLDFGVSDQDGRMLVLAALKEVDGPEQAKTRLYQVNLSRSDPGHADFTVITWFDGGQDLINQPDRTERSFDRINAMSFSDGKMALAAGDGRVYLFAFDACQRRFVPNPAVPWISLADMKFAVEDVLFISGDALAAVTVSRDVHLIDIKTLLIKTTLRGTNDGLQKLTLYGGQLVMATSYDGCLLELFRKGERFICRNKIPVGEWCWSLDRITASVYAVGYMSGIALADIDSGAVLSRIGGLEQKVEHLLYLPDAGNLLIAAIGKAGVRVYRVREENGGMTIEETSGPEGLDGYPCYWCERNENVLYLALGGREEESPCIAAFDLRQPLLGKEPSIIPLVTKKGRIRDIRMLDGHVIVSGLCGNNEKESLHQVGVFDISDPHHPNEVLTIKDLKAPVVHSAVFKTGPRNWRLAVIDLQSRGMLYQYTLTETEQGEFKADFVSGYAFPAILRNAAFDSGGDLMLTCLNGGLYRKRWADNEAGLLFRNKSDMLTFGTDMSDLYEPVDANSRLGVVLADFGNRLVKPERVIRRRK